MVAKKESEECQCSAEKYVCVGVFTQACVGVCEHPVLATVTHSSLGSGAQGLWKDRNMLTVWGLLAFPGF